MSPEIVQIIQRSLDTIERTLRSPITAKELADEAGFSLYHFYHVFEALTGQSVMRYIARRRLLHAAWDMSRGKDATSAALEYGFDTHAGFYKAFRREFGCAPSQYNRTHRAARPARINLLEEPKMIDMKTITCALSAWNMQDAPVSHVYYPNTGYRSDTSFAVGSKHYIKASSQPGELQRQAALQRALLAQQLAAPVVPTTAGEDVLHLDDMDFMLMQRLSGQSVNAVYLLDHPDEARAIGEGLARLHAALRECDPLLCYEEDYTATMCGWAIPTARAAMPMDAAWLEEYAARVAALFPLLPTQIIHRDPNPDNLRMENGRLIRFLDFDLTRIMPRIFDLCYAATGILCDAYHHVSPQSRLGFFKVARAIWDGYNDHTPLTETELAALPDMVLAIQLTCVAAFAGSDKLAQQFETNREMLRFIQDNIDLF